jgi:hypothetical protein
MFEKLTQTIEALHQVSCIKLGIEFFFCEWGFEGFECLKTSKLKRHTLSDIVSKELSIACNMFLFSMFIMLKFYFLCESEISF